MTVKKVISYSDIDRSLDPLKGVWYVVVEDLYTQHRYESSKHILEIQLDDNAISVRQNMGDIGCCDWYERFPFATPEEALAQFTLWEKHILFLKEKTAKYQRIMYKNWEYERLALEEKTNDS